MIYTDGTPTIANCGPIPGLDDPQREITEFAGHAAITVNGKRDPIFDGFTASGYRREFTLSELTLREKRDQASKLLQDRNGSTYDQAENIAGAASCYGGEQALDNLIHTLTR